MTVEIDNTTIKTFVGDTGEITFSDLNEGMIIYFGVRDKKTNTLIFDEISGVVNSEGEVTFTITPEMSNNFEVDEKLGYNTYYYGIKQVNEDTGEENTILLGDKPKISDKYFLKVYTKKVEGIIEEDG